MGHAPVAATDSLGHVDTSTGLHCRFQQTTDGLRQAIYPRRSAESAHR